MPDVFGLGQCSLDTIGRIPAWPSPDSKCEFSDMMVQGGGPVATALVALARWGVACHFAGVVGDDSFGQEISLLLRDEGIDSLGLMERPGQRSQFAFIASEPGGRRTIFWQRPTGRALQPAEIDFGLLRTSRVLHTDGLFIEASLAAASEAKRSGVAVSVDAGTLREGMLELARLSDCFVTSESFARSLVGGDDPLGACRKIVELGPRIAGVTLGSKGYAALFDGRFFFKPAYAVEVVDTTGCGDVFHAGLTYGLLQSWDPERSFDLAAWAAGKVATKMGGRAGIPSLAELRDRGYG
ncbi:MAG TPA: PfkB family carbohydrate kinase [Syntrophales bacterium]|nr:PfkB family carbohydrate kinase [Syntrophales bacterium]